METELFAILRQYSCLSPTSTIHLPTNIPRKDLQTFLLDHLLHNDLLTTYSPSSQYQRLFWKRIIAHLETNYDEACSSGSSFPLQDAIQDV